MMGAVHRWCRGGGNRLNLLSASDPVAGKPLQRTKASKNKKLKKPLQRTRASNKKPAHIARKPGI